ncbi:MAG: hypothetical protein WKF68_06425 [Daejeonella sp.]
MKLKLLIVLAAAGLTFAGCNSSNNTQNMEDSAVMDSVMRMDSVVVDTTAVMDTTVMDSM